MLDAMYMIVLRLYNGHAVIGTLRMFNLIAVLNTDIVYIGLQPAFKVCFFARLDSAYYFFHVLYIQYIVKGRNLI